MICCADYDDYDDDEDKEYDDGEEDEDDKDYVGDGEDDGHTHIGEGPFQQFFLAKAVHF